jgi:hypothetical protein
MTILTCTIALLIGTMTDRHFESSFPTIARWVDGKIVEQYELVDTHGIMQQIGATAREQQKYFRTSARQWLRKSFLIWLGLKV